MVTFEECCCLRCKGVRVRFALPQCVYASKNYLSQVALMLFVTKPTYSGLVLVLFPGPFNPQNIGSFQSLPFPNSSSGTATHPNSIYHYW